MKKRNRFSRDIYTFNLLTLGYKCQLNVSIYVVAAKGLAKIGVVNTDNVTDKAFVKSNTQLIYDFINNENVVPVQKSRPDPVAKKEKAKTKVKATIDYSKPIEQASNTALKKYCHPLLGTEKYKEFYTSQAWLQLRYLAIKNTNGKCQCCGSGASDGAVIQVDHIKPRSRYPELELSLDNLQVLCRFCNSGKGAWDDTSWK